MECGLVGEHSGSPYFGNQCQDQRGSRLTVSVVVSDVSSPAYTNGVLPPMAPLRLISVAKKKRSLTMLSFVVQHIDLPMECMA